MLRLPLAAWACVVLTACSPAAPAVDAATPPVQPRAPDAAVVRAPVVDPALSAFLSDWEGAQDTGDFVAYEALYAEKFTGVRRSGPRTRSFDRAGWLKDRKRMFAQPMQVDFRAESTVGEGATVIVTGEQTFRSAGYEDRGQKRLVLARESAGLRIVREEMLASEFAETPEISARFAFTIDEGGPLLAVLGRAPKDAPHGAQVSVHGTYLAALVYATATTLADAAPFLEGPVQLVSAAGACTTKAKALRLVHLVYPHFGQVSQWRGENGGPKASEKQLVRDIRALDPQGFWAVELEAGCLDAPLLAVPGTRSIAPFAHEALAAAGARDTKKRVLALPSVQALLAEDRDTAMADLTQTRFFMGEEQLVSAESNASCSAPSVSALFALGKKTRLLFSADNSGLEHVEAIADVDGDGTAEVIGHTGIGLDTWVVRDVLGRTRLRLSLPYFDCPC